jgi:hypothetical protein
MRTTIVNRKTITALALALMLVAPAVADVKEVWLAVKGATWATWGYSLVKGLKRQVGVDNAKLFLDVSMIQVTLKPGAWVEPSEMMQAIRDAGFTAVPENVRLTVTGTLRSRDGRFLLALDRMNTPLTLACVRGQQGGPPDPALIEKLGRVVELRGRWVAEPPGALEVETIGDITPPPSDPWVDRFAKSRYQIDLAER